MDRLKKLLDVAEQADKIELSVLHNAVVKTMGDYKQDPTAVRKKDWDAAREGLAETIDRLSRKYYPQETPAPEGERFANRKQAFDWLQAQGYKVSRGKFYTDCDAGFPAVHRDKSVSRYQVLQYGTQLDVERRGEADPAQAFDTARDEARKTRADADKAEMQAEAMRRELDKQWIRREAAEEETCVWVSRLRDAVAYHLGRELPALVLSCGGQSDRLAEAQAMVDAAIIAACNEIANAEEVTVEIEDVE